MMGKLLCRFPEDVRFNDRFQYLLFNICQISEIRCQKVTGSLIRTAGFCLREALCLTRTVGSFVNGVLLAEIAGAVSGRGGRMAHDPPPDLPLIAKPRLLKGATMDGTFE